MRVRCKKNVFITTHVDRENDEVVETCTLCGEIRIIKPGERQPLHARLGRPLRNPIDSRKGDV